MPHCFKNADFKYSPLFGMNPRYNFTYFQFLQNLLNSQYSPVKSVVFICGCLGWKGHQLYRELLDQGSTLGKADTKTSTTASGSYSAANVPAPWLSLSKGPVPWLSKSLHTFTWLPLEPSMKEDNFFCMTGREEGIILFMGIKLSLFSQEWSLWFWRQQNCEFCSLLSS